MNGDKTNYQMECNPNDLQVINSFRYLIHIITIIKSTSVIKCGNINEDLASAKICPPKLKTNV